MNKALSTSERLLGGCQQIFPAENASARAVCALRKVSIANGPGTLPDDPGSCDRETTGRAGLTIAPIALLCILVMGSPSPAGGVASGNKAHAAGLPDQSMMPVSDLFDHLTGLARSDTRWSLRLGRRPNTFYVTFGWDDPNDDETSDDPGDDDDGYEGLSAFSEAKVPVSALLLDSACFQSELAIPSQTLCAPLDSFTSFVMWNPLRC